MPDDLGFSYMARKNGDVAIDRGGRTVTVLRGAKARAFLAEAEGAGADHLQQVMARLTGNYKRGNERSAAKHPRNRRR